MNYRARRATCLLAAGAFCATSLTAAATATAQAAPSLRLGTPAGLKPIHPGAVSDVPASANTLTLQTSNTQGAVSPHPKVYLVFWGSQWSSDPAKAKPAMKNFFKGLHGTPDTYDNILTQYCEGLPAGTSHCGASGTHIVKSTTSILGGTWNDNATPEPTSATGAQLAAEAIKAAKHFGNTTQTPNLNAQYVILSPHGTSPDGFPNTICAYHHTTTSRYGMLAWTNMPYVPDLGPGGCTTISNPTALDGYFSSETHEYSETLTDFFVGTGWIAQSGAEIGDECVQLDSRITLPTGTFDVQGEWSNAANKCVTKG